MKHVFILNGFSDYNTNSVANKIIMACVNKDYDYKIEVNSDNYSTEDILRKYQDGKNIIYAVGGDGMINRVLNSMAKTDNILGYIPMGTGNDLNRSVNNTLKEGINDIDLIKINDKYFINVACFGIDADISADNLIHDERIIKSQRYNIAALKHFFTSNAKEFEVVIDNDVIVDKFSTIAVCNASFYGNGYNIAPRANMQDRLLDIYMVEKLNRLKLAKTILAMKKGLHENMDKVNFERSNNIKIFSRDIIKANIDGEVLEDNVFNIKVAPKTLKLTKDSDLIRRVKN